MKLIQFRTSLTVDSIASQLRNRCTCHKAVNNKLFSINLLEKPKTVYIRTYMTQRFTAYLVSMRRIQRAEYSTTMHNSDRIFIAAWAAH